MRRNNSSIVSTGVPIGGWNTRDALEGMSSTDAVILDNWFPTTGKVTGRNGFEEFTTGMGSGDVDTLAELHTGTVRKFIACANDNIYDITSGTPSSLASGLSSNQWDVANFKGRLFMVNGQDAPRDYDGTTLNSTSWTGSGLTISDLDGVHVFKNRLFFWDSSTQDFWYAGIENITGTLTKFPLSMVSQFGGNLVSVGTWTFDGGSGIDDYIVFMMSSGDVVIYQGTDPSDANAWALVGVYKIGRPLSSRGMIKFGGDLLVMTTDDYVSLSSVLKTGQVGSPSKLSGAIQEASNNNESLFGWQAVLYKQGEMLVFNVPITGESVQHVVNTTTLAACRFTGMNARCWGVYNEGLYFGGTDGKVYKADTGPNDNGDSIVLDGMPAWNTLGTAYKKRISGVRPVLETQGDVAYEGSVGIDYNTPLKFSPSESTTTTSVWDVALWDVSLWSSELTTSASWKVAAGIGRAISYRVRVQALQQVSWIGQDYLIEKGGGL